MKGKIREAERERDKAIKEQDNRANITNPEHERLLNQKKQAEDNLAH